VLEMGEGKEPLGAARAFRESSGVRFESDPREVRIGGFRAAQALAKTRSARLHLTWIAKGDGVYQLAGASAPDDFAAFEPVFEGTASSFRALARGDRERIRDHRLRLFRAQPGEMIGHVVGRTRASWSPEEAAVANAVQIDQRLTTGRLVKIAVAERYEAD
jgi:predicted Zn-dependent protease